MTTRPIRLFRAAASEIAEIAALDTQVFRDEMNSTPYGHTVLRQFFDLAPGLLHGARVDQHLVGYALGGVGSDSTGWLLTLCVVRGQRRGGIGRRLVESVVDDMAELHLAHVKLCVHPGNHAARDLYDSLGFQQVGADSNYFGIGEPRVVMERRVEAARA